VNACVVHGNLIVTGGGGAGEDVLTEAVIQAGIGANVRFVNYEVPG
jgi:hypothetical protein